MATLQTRDKNDKKGNNFLAYGMNLQQQKSRCFLIFLSRGCRNCQEWKNKQNTCESRRLTTYSIPFCLFETSYIPRQNRINSKRYCIRSDMFTISGALLFAMRFQAQKYCFWLNYANIGWIESTFRYIYFYTHIDIGLVDLRISIEICTFA